jgi:hypothetical protein
MICLYGGAEGYLNLPCRPNQDTNLWEALFKRVIADKNNQPAERSNKNGINGKWVEFFVDTGTNTCVTGRKWRK